MGTRWMRAAGAALVVGALSGPGAGLTAQTPETAWNGLEGLVALESLAAVYGTQEVQGADLYRQARRALNRSEFGDAADLFHEVRLQYPSSELAGDTYYYQAFALYRLGQESSAGEARGRYAQSLSLLEAQRADFPDAPTASDARELRVRVESALARDGDAEARAAVSARAQEACDEEESEMRAVALSALMNMDASRAGPLLREVIQDRDQCNAELRARAVFILAQNHDDNTVDLLLDIAHRNPDPDPEVRGQAVFWLSQVDRPEAVDALVALVEGGDEELLEGALFALSQHDDPRAYDALENLLRTHEDPEVRAKAIFGLSQHHTERAGALLRQVAMNDDEDPEVRGQAIFWLGQTDGALAELTTIFRSETDRELKNNALFAISQDDSPEAVEFLMEVARDDDDPEIRSQAVFWLGQSDDPRVPEFLLELIRR